MSSGSTGRGEGAAGYLVGGGDVGGPVDGGGDVPGGAVVGGPLVGGSLFWIIKHQLIARSPILRFGDAEGGRVAIHIDPKLILTQARPKRAHQGWRYLEDADAPVDLDGDMVVGDQMPAALMGKLAGLGLI